MQLSAHALFRKREFSQALKALFSGNGPRVIKFSGSVSKEEAGDEERRRKRIELDVDLSPVGVVRDADPE